MSKLLSVNQLTETLGVSRDSVYRYVRRTDPVGALLHKENLARKKKRR